MDEESAWRMLSSFNVWDRKNLYLFSRKWLKSIKNHKMRDKMEHEPEEVERDYIEFRKEMGEE